MTIIKCRLTKYFQCPNKTKQNKKLKNVQRTFSGGQTNWPNEIGDWYTIVESQKSHIIIKIRKTEWLRNGAKNKTCLWSCFIITSIVFAKGYLDHKPHETKLNWRKEKNKKKWRKEKHFKIILQTFFFVFLCVFFFLVICR